VHVEIFAFSESQNPFDWIALYTKKKKKKKVQPASFALSRMAAEQPPSKKYKMANPNPAAPAKSWVEYPAESEFPLQNLPYGVFTRAGQASGHIGVAIGDQVCWTLHTLLDHFLKD
jgi:hypothetical protein